MRQRFFRDQDGATAIEYAIIAAMLSLAIIAGVTMLGGELKTTYETAATKVSDSVN